MTSGSTILKSSLRQPTVYATLTSPRVLASFAALGGVRPASLNSPHATPARSISLRTSNKPTVSSFLAIPKVAPKPKGSAQRVAEEDSDNLSVDLSDY